MTKTLRRVLPAGVGMALFLVLTALWLSGAHQSYAAFLSPLGFHPFRFPFLDTHAVLAAIECHRLGVDVYANNTCDVLRRPHVYSPLWLHLDVLPITTAWTGPVGLALDLLFLVSLVILPPARGAIGTLIVAAAVVSPSVVFALERANNDLVIFLFSVLAGWLVVRSSWLRLSGYLVVVLAAALKFYPVTLLILAWRERWPRCLMIIALSLAGLAACLLPEKESLVRALQLVPPAAFGAAKIPTIFTEKLGWPAWSRIVIQGTMVLVMAFRALQWSRQLQPGLNRLSETERVFLTVGATLIVGCFLAGTNNDYRSIHLLFALPALLALAAGRDGYSARMAVTLVLGVMWSDALRATPAPLGRLLWLAAQCAWWVVVTALLASLLAQLRDSLAMQTLRAMPAYARAKRLGYFG
jgi:hypothetical protein